MTESGRLITDARHRKARALRRLKGWEAGGLRVICEGLLLLSLAVVVLSVGLMYCIHGMGAARASAMCFDVAMWALGVSALLGLLLLGIHFLSRKL